MEYVVAGQFAEGTDLSCFRSVQRYTASLNGSVASHGYCSLDAVALCAGINLSQSHLQLSILVAHGSSRQARKPSWQG